MCFFFSKALEREAVRSQKCSAENKLLWDLCQLCTLDLWAGQDQADQAVKNLNERVRPSRFWKAPVSLTLLPQVWHGRISSGVGSKCRGRVWLCWHYYSSLIPFFLLFSFISLLYCPLLHSSNLSLSLLVVYLQRIHSGVCQHLPLSRALSDHR